MAKRKGKEKRREDIDPMPDWEPVKEPQKTPVKPKRELVPAR